MAKTLFSRGWLWGGLALMAGMAMAQPDPDAETRPVAGFRLSGNTLIEADRLQALLQDYRGRRGSPELRKAALALQAAYRDAGYGAVVVSVAPPGFDGMSNVSVLEGRMAKVVVVGAEQFSAAAIRHSVPALAEGQTPRVADINRQVELANQNPARKLAITLEPGQAVGEVDARMMVSESPVQRWQLAADNTGTAQSGRTRVSVGYRHANLMDRGHQLSANYQTSLEKPSRVSIISMNYVVPLPASARRVDVYAVRSNVDGGSTPTAAGALQFNGRGNVLGIQATQLLQRRGEWDQRLRVGLDQREYRNRCRIEGLPEGACGAAGESVTVQPFSLDYSLHGGQAVQLGGNVALSHNLGLGGRLAKAAAFEAVRPGAKRRYTALRLGAQAQKGGGKSWGWIARAAAQWTPDALVPGEQFGLTGAGAVRGYREREVVGDRGVMASLELLSPQLAVPGRADAQLHLLGFVDWGKVWMQQGDDCRQGLSRCAVHALGFGLRLNEGSWRLQLDLARAGRAGALTESGDLRLHFAASYGLD